MHQEIREEEKEIEIDVVRLLRNVLEVVKKIWFILALVIAIGAAVSLFVQKRGYVPEYKAYCTFSVHVINKATLSDTNSLYAVIYGQNYFDG